MSPRADPAVTRGRVMSARQRSFLAPVDPEMRVTGPLDQGLIVNRTYRARLAAGSASCGNGVADRPDVISW